MPPNVSSTGSCLKKCEEVTNDKTDTKINDNNGVTNNEGGSEKRLKWYEFKTELIWFNIIYIILLHIISLYCICTFSITENWKTTLWSILSVIPAAFGVTGGAHRLWTHRAYKAKWPLRVILFLCFCCAGQNTVYDWVRDHRVHHKYSETDADPHNSKRGFFFAHVGWLMMRKHPEVIRRGRQVDMTDILEDPVVRIGDKLFPILRLLCAFVIPTLIPVYGWNETWYRAIASQIFIRYVYTLNGTWSVNSAAHIWGNKPYDRNIKPVENKVVSFITMGEGWHNYHHVFPWDYKAAELGNYSMNMTTMFIDMFAKIGWAYDLKEPSADLVKAVALRRGDGSHPHWPEEPEPEPDSKTE